MVNAVALLTVAIVLKRCEAACEAPKGCEPALTALRATKDDETQCGAGYSARGPAFQRVLPPERRPAARIGSPTVRFRRYPTYLRSRSSSRPFSPLSCSVILRSRETREST